MNTVTAAPAIHPTREEPASAAMITPTTTAANRTKGSAAHPIPTATPVNDREIQSPFPMRLNLPATSDTCFLVGSVALVGSTGLDPNSVTRSDLESISIFAGDQAPTLTSILAGLIRVLVSVRRARLHS